jgi:hypothetical protein
MAWSSIILWTLGKAKSGKSELAEALTDVPGRFHSRLHLQRPGTTVSYHAGNGRLHDGSGIVGKLTYLGNDNANRDRKCSEDRPPQAES